LSDQLYDSKIWRKDSKNSSKKLDKNNLTNENSFHINNNIDNLSISPSSVNKKFPYLLHQSKPSGLINKRIDIDKFNSYNNNSNNHIIHNLSKISQNKKNNNNLLLKIKEKVSKENILPKNIKLNNKISLQNNEINKSQSVHSSLKSSSNSNEEPNNLNNKTDENSDKKESNEDEDDILSEQKDEMEEGVSNMLSINKVGSINIHSNFMIGHNENINRISLNSNTSHSNKSSNKDKCNTEPNNQTFFRHRVNPMSVNYIYPNKNSFLSTNTNSHNQSGHKIDSSLSSESGQSFLSNYQTLQFNHTMNNFRNNNNFLFPFPSEITPIGSRHIYTNDFNSNEKLFNNNNKQLFSLNLSYQKQNKIEYNNKFNNNNNNFGSKSKNIPINLDNIALGKETRTTVMIKNIPIKYDTKILLKELEHFDGKFNCLYMPYDYSKNGNKGYAFLNFVNPLHILLFYEWFHGKSWLFFESKKICDLYYANYQGIEEIKNHAKNYKGNKKSFLFIDLDEENINNIIEIPIKYLNLLLKANPKMKFQENRIKNTFIINSFN
jgi:hypothetical protein